MPIKGHQIGAGELDNSHIKAGAGITSDKLADGANFIKKDGSTAFTGSPNFGNQPGINVGTPTPGTTQVARIIDVENAVANLNSAYKYRTVRVASTANINIANPGTATFDTIVLTAADVLLGSMLLKDQTAPAENGLYLFNGPGVPLTRLANADAWVEFPGSLINVSEGATNGDKRWKCTSDDGGTLGTTAITYASDASNGLTSANFVDKEVPTGVINGVNAIFTLANVPTSGTDHWYRNGVLQNVTGGLDYTIAGAVATFVIAPIAGEKIVCSYRK